MLSVENDDTQETWEKYNWEDLFPVFGVHMIRNKIPSFYYFICLVYICWWVFKIKSKSKNVQWWY
jgi:ABC-type uncharacterized transport system permease subunit